MDFLVLRAKNVLIFNGQKYSAVCHVYFELVLHPDFSKILRFCDCISIALAVSEKKEVSSQGKSLSVTVCVFETILYQQLQIM